MIEWYNYDCFRFARHQIIWVIENRAVFDEGKWPSEPCEYETDEKVNGEWVVTEAKSSYVGLQGRGPFKCNAYFINPATVWAEISRRLKLTETEGKLLIEEIDNMGEPCYENLKHQESKDALNYISLFDFRKRPPYSQWKRQRAYYQRKISTKR